MPYRHYWLEGPNPLAAWDRDSCYGDVFVVQDASDFYLAVYLIGQRKAKVRGMPTSIPFSETNMNSDYLILPDSFSVRLFNIHTKTWHSLDKQIGRLDLHPERRRGKASGAVDGNLLNDYQMLGLFDPEGKITNPNIDSKSSIEGLKGEPLPLFFVWLGEKRSDQEPKTQQ